MSNLPDVTTLSDEQLWDIYLKPDETNMPDEVKKYLQKARMEFRKRKLKLKPII